MAYNKIKNIKFTIASAIEYITNKSKTGNGKYVYGFKVTPQTAAEEFRLTEKLAKSVKGDYKRENANLGYHIIQSFDYRDVLTPEEAMEIGKKLMDEFTDGKFEYVLATHVDKTCVHNHIIFNSVSYVDYKRFLSKPYKTIEKLVQISNKLCAEKGLRVTEFKKKEFKTYYEWSMEKEGLSWKKTLKNIIDKNILKASNFDEFIELMKKDEYEIKSGKYIAFKHKGQERFIRAYKLGLDYSEEQIKSRIITKAHTVQKSQKEVPAEIRAKLKTRYKAIDNIKEISELLLKLENEYSISDREDLVNAKGESSTKYNAIKQEIKSIEDTIKEKQESYRNALIYLKYKDIHESYEKAFNKKKFYEKYESQLILFDKAEKSIPKDDLENIEVIKESKEKEIKALQDNVSNLMMQLHKEKEKIDTIEKLEKKLENIEEKEQGKEEKTKKNKFML